MFKSATLLSFILGIVYAIIKLIAFKTGKTFEWFTPIIFTSIFFTLVSAFLGVYLGNKTNEYSPALIDVKNGLKAVSVYALTVAAFCFVYYKWINADFLISRQEAFSATNSQGSSSFVFSPFNYSTMTLIGIIALGFLDTLLVTFLVRNFFRKI